MEIQNGSEISLLLWNQVVDAGDLAFALPENVLPPMRKDLIS